MSTRPISSVVTGVSFSYYTAEEVRRLSVKEIVNPVAFDELQNPVPGGLYDPALGPIDQGVVYPHPGHSCSSIGAHNVVWAI